MLYSIRKDKLKQAGFFYLFYFLAMLLGVLVGLLFDRSGNMFYAPAFYSFLWQSSVHLLYRENKDLRSDQRLRLSTRSLLSAQSTWLWSLSTRFDLWYFSGSDSSVRQLSKD